MAATKVKCPSGHINLAGQNFCGECGVSLSGLPRETRKATHARPVLGLNLAPLADGSVLSGHAVDRLPRQIPGGQPGHPPNAISTKNRRPSTAAKLLD
jgi:hypothetical protein